MSWKAMEVSMSKTRRGKYIDNRIYHKGKCKGDMRFNLRGKGKLPCFSYLCEGNHFRFIEERYCFSLDGQKIGDKIFQGFELLEHKKSRDIEKCPGIPLIKTMQIVIRILNTFANFVIRFSIP